MQVRDELRHIAWFEPPSLIRLVGGQIESDGERLAFPQESPLRLLDGIEAHRLVYVGADGDAHVYRLRPPAEARRRQYVLSPNELACWQAALHGIAIPAAHVNGKVIVQGAMHGADARLSVCFATELDPLDFMLVGTLFMPAPSQHVLNVLHRSDIPLERGYAALAYEMHTETFYDNVYKVYEIEEGAMVRAII